MQWGSCSLWGKIRFRPRLLQSQTLEGGSLALGKCLDLTLGQPGFESLEQAALRSEPFLLWPRDSMGGWE